jgi:hypothetical protein
MGSIIILDVVQGNYSTRRKWQAVAGGKLNGEKTFSNKCLSTRTEEIL